MLSILKKPLFIIFVIVAFAIAVSYFYLFGEEKIDHEFTIAKRQDLISEVNVIGRIKPASEVSLAFERTGKIMKI